jgi:3-phenylpropionate/cinnamic acid dioxygenase small subunit
MDDLTYVALLRLYARQSHLIDGGDAHGWAETFTTDGEFHSPSYPEPVRGHDALVEFASGFTRADEEAGTRSRHVVTTVDAEHGERLTTARARAYLQIVSTPVGGPSRLVRHTAIEDDLVLAAGGWRVLRRRVSRDDEPPNRPGAERATDDPTIDDRPSEDPS